METQKQSLQQQVHHLFREFGRGSCDMVVREIVRHGSLTHILDSMALPDPGYNEDRLTVILNFVRRHGVREFIDRLNPPAPSRIEWTERRPLEKRTASSSRAEKIQSLQKQDLNPTWDGVERRRGADRRDNNERRQQVELVFHNSRYDDDRRHGRERRKNWPMDDRKLQ